MKKDKYKCEKCSNRIEIIMIEIISKTIMPEILKFFYWNFVERGNIC